MRTDEVIIKIIGRLDLMYGSVIKQQETKLMLEEVLYDYDVETKSTALAPLNNMQDMMMLYLASKKIEGSSRNTIESYGRNLLKFSNDIMKNVEDITTVQSILGHSELSTTQIYSKTSDSNVKYEYKKYMAN